MATENPYHKKLLDLNLITAIPFVTFSAKTHTTSVNLY